MHVARPRRHHADVPGDGFVQTLQFDSRTVDGFDGVKGKMEDVDIPEKVDVIVSEWMGYALLFESMLPSVVDARDRYLAPGGLVLPNEAAVKVALLSDRDRWDGAVTFWEDVYGLDFSALIPAAKRDCTRIPVQTVPADKLASNRQPSNHRLCDCRTGASVRTHRRGRPHGGVADVRRPRPGAVVRRGLREVKPPRPGR